MPDADEALIRLVQVISRRETASALNQIAASPNLALARLTDGTPLEWPKASYAGDTALHIAAAVYEIDVARRLLSMGADVMARNRRGAEPLHYAAVGSPGSALWAPERQAAMIEWLVKAGADPDAADMNGVRPLHRAVRTRCAAAVKALIDAGADPQARNGSGTAPARLAELNTGRSGSGSAEAKAEQQIIIRLLKPYNV